MIVFHEFKNVYFPLPRRSRAGLFVLSESLPSDSLILRFPMNRNISFIMLMLTHVNEGVSKTMTS